MTGISWIDNGIELGVIALQASFYAGMLAMVMLVINLLFRRWLSAAQMGLLWSLVLLRLCLPVTPASPLSLEHLLGAALAGNAVNEPAANPPSTDVQMLGPDGQLIGQGGGSAMENSQNTYASPAEGNTALASAQAEPPVVPWLEIEEFVLVMFLYTSLFGPLLGLGWLIATIVVYARFCRQVRHSASCDDPRLLRLWNDTRKLARVRREIPIVLFGGVEQPAVMGLFRTKLLLPLPAVELDDDQLRMIMLHELAHVRRWDIAANWLLAMIRAVHWWNPVYWLASSRYRSLREQACDAFVIRSLGGEQTRGYGELLLTLAGSETIGPRWRVMLPATIQGFFPSFFRRRAVRKRLLALHRAGIVRGRWHTALVAGVMGVVAVSGWTEEGSSASLPAGEDDSAWLPQTSQSFNEAWFNRDADPGATITAHYELTDVLARIAKDLPPESEPRDEIESLVKKLMRVKYLPLAYLNGGNSDLVARMQKDDSDRSYKLEGTILRFCAPPPLQEELWATLQAWEQSGLGRKIAVECRVMSFEHDVAAVAGLSWQQFEAFTPARQGMAAAESDVPTPKVHASSRSDDFQPVVMAVLNNDQFTVFKRAAQAELREHAEASLMQLPRLVLANGLETWMEDVEMRPFVVGIRLVPPDAEEPKIVVLKEGTMIRMRPVRSRDQQRIRLTGRIEFNAITEVQTASTKLNGHDTAIQLPRLKQTRIDVAQDFEPGQSLLIGCIPSYEQKKFLYFLVTVYDAREGD